MAVRERRGRDITIIACQCESSAGKAADEAAKTLVDKSLRQRRLSQQAGMIHPVQVLIDGCTTGCAQAALARTRMKADLVIVLTEDVGIGKYPASDPLPSDIVSACDIIAWRLSHLQE